MIPKNIHYCWFGNNPIPSYLKKYIKSWQEKCPDYIITQWNENNFDVNCNEFVKEAYKSEQWAFVSDYARLKIIYENGGVYLDTDVEILKNFDDLLENKAFFAIQQNGCYVNTGLCFGAEQKHNIVKKIMDIYDVVEFSEANKKNLACPYLNTKTLENNGFQRKDETQYLKKFDTIIYSSKYFDPITPDTTDNLLCEESYSIHHYSASWLSKKKKFTRRISNIIGQNKINIISYFIKKIRSFVSKR